MTTRIRLSSGYVPTFNVARDLWAELGIGSLPNLQFAFWPDSKWEAVPTTGAARVNDRIASSTKYVDTASGGTVPLLAGRDKFMGGLRSVLMNDTLMNMTSAAGACTTSSTTQNFEMWGSAYLFSSTCDLWGDGTVPTSSGTETGRVRIVSGTSIRASMGPATVSWTHGGASLLNKRFALCFYRLSQKVGFRLLMEGETAWREFEDGTNRPGNLEGKVRIGMANIAGTFANSTSSRAAFGPALFFNGNSSAGDITKIKQFMASACGLVYT